jgi:hypothetical protein
MPRIREIRVMPEKLEYKIGVMHAVDCFSLPHASKVYEQYVQH